MVSSLVCEEFRSFYSMLIANKRLNKQRPQPLFFSPWEKGRERQKGEKDRTVPTLLTSWDRDPLTTSLGIRARAGDCQIAIDGLQESPCGQAGEIQHSVGGGLPNRNFSRTLQ